MDYEIAASGWEPHGSPGWMSLINITLTSFVTSRSLVRTGVLISCGKGTLARFNLNPRDIEDRLAQRGLTLGTLHDTSKYANNRAELSHQSTGFRDSQNLMVTPYPVRWWCRRTAREDFSVCLGTLVVKPGG
jgi:hypothetical protein